ncbi:apolipoprotein L6 isoform X2 [Rhinolophus sinicus]|uniref:apolipoprotein L6 isoform X2 n=1 Tax=Rhinolophus sinicus TaxID=89399 RepID=UPI003D78E1FB
MSKDVALQSLRDDKAGDKDAIFLCEDEEQQDRVLSAEDSIFLQEFPTIKRELEVAIQENLALADEIDRAHETFATTRVVTSSVAVASSVMSILGLALAPVTVGGSLVLSAAGTGVGTVAGAASVLTNILEHNHNERVQAQVSRQVSTCDQEVGQPADKLASYVMSLYNQGKNIKSIKKNIDALQIARAHPRLASAAKRLLTTGQVSARRARQVQKAFGGTTLVLKRSTYLLGSAMAGLGLGVELHSLVNEWKHLKEGAKAKYAEVLRAHAAEQERQLAELTQHYESLRQKVLEEKSRSLLRCCFNMFFWFVVLVAILKGMY